MIRRFHSIFAALLIPLTLVILSGCGDRPSDFLDTGEETNDTGDTGGTVDTGSAATCILDMVTGSTGDVTITFSTADTDGDGLTVFIQFSTDTGATYSLCSAATSNTFPNGGTGLSASTMSRFIWDTVADVGVTTTSVRIRVTVADSLNPASNCDSTDITLNSATPGTAPSCAISAPSAGSTVGGDIPVSYTLTDTDDLTTASILAEYSTDAGVSFLPATIAAASADGTTGLSTSTTGASHTYLWDSRTNLPGQDTAPIAGVTFRITPTDVDGTGTACTSGSLTVDGSTPVNTAPSCILVNPMGGETLFDAVTVDYTLSDSEQATGTISPAFSTDGGVTSMAAAEIPGAPSEGTTGLAMSLAGTMHSFVWDSTLDVGAQGAAPVNNVQFRITPNDGTFDGSTCQSMDFTLDAPRSFAVGSVVIKSTDGSVSYNDNPCCDAFSSPALLFSIGETEQLTVEASFSRAPNVENVSTATSSSGTTTYMVADSNVVTVDADGAIKAAATGANRCTTLSVTYTPDNMTALGFPELRTIACCVDIGGSNDLQRAGPDGVEGNGDDFLAIGDLDCDFPGSASAPAVGVGGDFQMLVTVNAGTDSLGAYGLDIMFDNTVINIDTLAGADGAGVTTSMAHPSFTILANPENNMGRMRVNGFDTGMTNVGIFDVCTIHCTAIGSGTSPWAMTISDLASTPGVTPIGAATPRLAVAGSSDITIP